MSSIASGSAHFEQSGTAALPMLPAPDPTFAAVLFADIVGFTRLCETLAPADSFTLLAGFHHRMARIIAAHAAAVDEQIGDGVMAVWTGSEPDSIHAACALSCGVAILDCVQRWNRERVRYGNASLRVGIGIHAGTVVIGRVGDADRAKLGVFGDTVNVANRLERMTRSYPSDLIASDALLRMAASGAAPEDVLLQGFRPAVEVRIPGRTQRMLIRAAHDPCPYARPI